MRNTKPTFSEILNNSAQKNSERLMKKARLANRLAKRASGKNRRQAYQVKADALVSLVRTLPHKVNILNDIKLPDFVVVELKNAASGLHLPAGKLRGI